MTDKQSRWLEQVENYSSMFMPDEEDTSAIQANKNLLNIMSLSEANIVTSMTRNIGYHKDVNFKPGDDEGGFDLVYKIIIVVRDNPLLLEQCITDEDIEEYHERLYTTALETVKLWYAIAVMVYEGIKQEDIDWNDPRMKKLQPDIRLPRKTGSPTITVFGDVVDPQGRSTSLTVTDQTNPEYAIQRMTRASWLWDKVTELSHGHDFNQNGRLPFRNVSKGRLTPKNRRSPRMAIKKASSSESEDSNPSVTPTKDDEALELAKPVKPKASKKPENKAVGSGKKKVTMRKSRPEKQTNGGVPMCHTMADVRDVAPRTTFDMRVAKIEHDVSSTGKRGLYFYGFYEDENGGVDVDGSDRIWVFQDDPSFHPLMNTIAEYAPGFDEGNENSMDTLDSEVVIRATKSVSDKKKTAYYRDAEILRWD